MARVRVWRTRPFTATLDGGYAEIDLLAGSGFAEEGATVQRVIGSFSISGVWKSQVSDITLRWGVVDTVTPAYSTISSSSNAKFLAYQAMDIRPPGWLPGDPLNIPAAHESTSFDSEGQRVLEAGQSIWLMARVLGLREDPEGTITGFTRCLVLRPEGSG